MHCKINKNSLTYAKTLLKKCSVRLTLEASLVDDLRYNSYGRIDAKRPFYS